MNIEIHHTADEYWFPDGHITIGAHVVVEGITEDRIKLAHQIAALPDLIEALKMCVSVKHLDDEELLQITQLLITIAISKGETK